MFTSNILLLPLLSSLFTGFGGNFMGRKGSVLISIICMLICCLDVGAVFYKTIFLNQQLQIPFIL